MTKRRELVPAEDVDISTVQYRTEVIQAPHITGLALKLSTKMLETPGVGSLIIYLSKKQNKMNEVLRNTSIPETPMSRPDFPPQEQETGVEVVDEDGKPNERLESAANCLPPYDSASLLNWDSTFRYWKIRDYAYAYRSKLVTPSTVAEHFISVIKELKEELPHAPLLISFDEEELKKQAADSTKRFQEEKPISILDGIFIAIKDDIDCLPHPTKGGTTWIHELRAAEKDAVSVSRLRRCGAILVGKANMHEIGMGITGNNPNYGTTRNPHDLERYPGGSSSGPAAIVASGLCPAALGTDAGGSVRIPASLCGVVGLKPTFGRIDMEGSFCDSGTVGSIGLLASSVEDVMLVYSAILGSNPADKIDLKPSPPCLPKLTSSESLECLGLLRLGKYTKWFNDVDSTEISDKCDEILKLLSKTYGTEMKEIVIPELHDIRIAHLVTIGAEALYLINPYCADGNDSRLTCDTRTFLALFRSFGGADFIAAQCLRRRLMYHHMRIFEKVDAIVTPTTCMTAPLIPPSSLSYGESNIQITGHLGRFVIGANLLGFPAISVPVGYDKQGLPIGLQLIGRPWSEATLLRLASAIEELCPNSKKKPVTFYDVLKAK